MLPILRSDFQMVNNYSISTDKKLKSPILTIRGTQDKEITKDDLKGWEKYTTGIIVVEEIVGGHFLISEKSEEIIEKIIWFNNFVNSVKA